MHRHTRARALAHTQFSPPPSQHAPDSCFLLPVGGDPSYSLPLTLPAARFTATGSSCKFRWPDSTRMISSLWTCHCPQLQVRTLGPRFLNLPPKGRGNTRQAGLSDQGKAPWGPTDPSCCLSPDQVLRHSPRLAQAYNLSIPRQELQVFVQEHFCCGQELQPWTPED